MTIAKAIVEGDVNAAFRYLALQEREEWAEIREHLVRGAPGGAPLQTEIIIRRVDAAGVSIPDSAIECETLDDDEDPA